MSLLFLGADGDFPVRGHLSFVDEENGVDAFWDAQVSTPLASCPNYWQNIWARSLLYVL
jgi:hypothetical protein